MSESRPSALMEQVERLRYELEVEGVYERLNKAGSWVQVCAALDVLDDTELTLYAFDSRVLANKDVFVGEKYLRVYGLMQAIQLKIDATRTLVRELGGPNPDKKAPIIRALMVRGLLAGHPMRQVERGTTTSAFTSQIELESGALRVMQLKNGADANSVHNIEKIEIHPLLFDLDAAVVQCLEGVTTMQDLKR